MLPADSHLGVYVVHTLYALLNGMALYPRSRVLCQLSTTPNVAVRVICCGCLGAAPHRFTPRQAGCYALFYLLASMRPITAGSPL